MAESPGVGRAQMRSPESELGPQLVLATSSEFEELMQDSVETDGGSGLAASSAPRAAVLHTPRPLSESPEAPPLHASPALAGVGCGEQGETEQQPRMPPPLPADAPAAAAVTSSEAIPPCRSSGDPWALEALAGRLDDISREMKRSVEHEFSLAQRSVQARHNADLEAQRLQAEAAACQQRVIVESLQQEKAQLMSKLEAKQRQVKSSLSLLQHTRRNLTGRCCLEAALLTWRACLAAEKDARLQALLAAKVRRSRLSGLTFASWRQQAQLARSDAAVARERAAAETVRCKLFEEMEQDRMKAASTIDLLSRQLAEEQRQRALLQENLKRVFMRGVCALNFEAMSLLSDGTSGAEPSSDGSFTKRLRLEPV